MTYKILKTNPRCNTHEFFIDEIEDLQILPKESASTALIAATGDIYICTNNKEWIKFNNCYCDRDSDESGGIVPTGTIFINENNIYDISEYATAEVVVPNPSIGTLNVTANNTYDVTQYASVNVNVPNPSIGTLTITANNTYDVTQYANVNVNVPTVSWDGSLTITNKTGMTLEPGTIVSYGENGTLFSSETLVHNNSITIPVQTRLDQGRWFPHGFFCIRCLESSYSSITVTSENTNTPAIAVLETGVGRIPATKYVEIRSSSINYFHVSVDLILNN